MYGRHWENQYGPTQQSWPRPLIGGAKSLVSLPCFFKIYLKFQCLKMFQTFQAVTSSKILATAGFCKIQFIISPSNLCTIEWIKLTTFAESTGLFLETCPSACNSSHPRPNISLRWIERTKNLNSYACTRASRKMQHCNYSFMIWTPAALL